MSHVDELAQEHLQVDSKKGLRYDRKTKSAQMKRGRSKAKYPEEQKDGRAKFSRLQ